MTSAVSLRANLEPAHSTWTPACASARGTGRSCSVEAGCMKTASVFDGFPGRKRIPSQFTMPCEPEKP
jgi:hypothetical protein